MKHIYGVLFLIFSVSLSFAQTSDKPCNPGDPDGKPGCPSGDCPDNPNSKPSFSIPVVRPLDPNEIIGRTGYDSLVRWVSAKQTLEYKVLFENDPDFATAPAQNVTIYVPIHEKLNPSSLRISDFGFGSFNFSVPPNTSVYTNRLDVRDSLGVFVDITAGLDVANRRAFWIFQSIDPKTGLAATLPANTGFLPVNDSLKHNGEGYVTFTVLPSSRSVTKDTISAQASIIFDIEETLATNIWKNTIDAGTPSSHVTPLPSQSGSTTFTISWEGQDDASGSGIRNYDLYVSENNNPYALYKSGLTGTSTTFTGNQGSNYRFYTLANDNVGNKEDPPTVADAQTTIGCIAPSVSISPASVTLTCASPTVSLSVVGTGNVLWSTGATTASISVSTAGTYSVTLTSSSGCSATANVTVEAALNSSISSVKDGRWDDPTTWSCGRIPKAGDVVTIGHVVSVPASYTGAAKMIRYSSGKLIFGTASKIQLGL